MRSHTLQRMVGTLALAALFLGGGVQVWGSGPLGQAERPGGGASAGPTGVPGAQSTYWQVETLDTNKDLLHLGDHALALDAAGQPYIAYGGDSLYYARYDGSGWWREKVDDTVRASKYAHYDGSSWQIETVAGDLGDDARANTSLALDSLDLAHISYHDGVQGDLKYASYDGSSWQTETVDSAGVVGNHSSLALDTADVPHISYSDATLPVTFTWDNGATGPTAAYSWTAPGTYTLAVTATNPCGSATNTLVVVVSSVPYRVYLPLVERRP